MKEIIHNIRRVYQYGKQYQFSLILEIVGSLIGIVISILLPILTAKQIVYLTDNIWIQLITVSSVVLIVQIISQLKTILIRKNTQKFTKGITENIQNKLASEILKISQEEIDKNSSGTFIQRLTSDASQLSSMFTVGIGHLTGVISSIGIFLSILIISRECFIFYFITSMILTIFHMIKAKKYSEKDKLLRNQTEKVTGIIDELVRGSRDIKMLHAKEPFMNYLNKNIILRNERTLDMRNVDISYNFWIGTLTSAFEFSLVILLIYLIQKNSLTVALAIALYSYSLTFSYDKFKN